MRDHACEYFSPSELSDLKKKMLLWINYGVISVPSTGVYAAARRLRDRDGSQGKGSGLMLVTSEGDESDRAVSGEEQMLERMKVFEQYITGMLTNLGALPLQRIHNMLKMFARLVSTIRKAM